MRKTLLLGLLLAVAGGAIACADVADDPTSAAQGSLDKEDKTSSSPAAGGTKADGSASSDVDSDLDTDSDSDSDCDGDTDSDSDTDSDDLTPDTDDKLDESDVDTDNDTDTDSDSDEACGVPPTTADAGVPATPATGI